MECNLERRPFSIPDWNKEVFSVEGLLRRVLVEELGSVCNSRPLDYKLMIVAVHAILLDSGFVRLDDDNHWGIVDLRYSPFSTVTLCYTLPQISSKFSLKIRARGKFIYFHGSISSNTNVKYHSVRLSEDLLAPIHALFKNNYYCKDMISDFWRSVKDKLASPMLVDLCEEAGLAPPPNCFTGLHRDIKTEILKLLSSSDLKNASLVCQDLYYLVFRVRFVSRDRRNFLQFMGLRVQVLAMKRRRHFVGSKRKRT